MITLCTVKTLHCNFCPLNDAQTCRIAENLHLSCIKQDGETTNTMIMAHPPGSENDPDDRDQYVQENGYAEDADGNMIGGAEGEQVPEGWGTHEGTMQACSRTWPLIYPGKILSDISVRVA